MPTVLGGLGEPIRITILRSGPVAEIATFLSDLESAYNALYTFELTLSRWQRRRRFFPPFFPDEFFGLPWREADARDVLPEYQLELKRISIRSPGWVEVLGALNPLREIREYLKDRHERRKDQAYREGAEKERLTLENDLLRRQILEKDTSIFRDQIALLKEAGASDDEIRQFVWSRLGQPLARLGRHQDTKLIEGPRNDRSDEQT